MKDEEIDRFVLELTQAEGLKNLGVVQSLWSGYGSIDRMGLEGTQAPSVIVKHVQPGNGKHPRGWNTDLSHQRKLKSYQVETHWYGRQKERGEPGLARIPECLGVKTDGDEVLLVLEDLDAVGFAGRRSSVNQIEWQSCVRWLAAFHAEHLGAPSEGLWESGTYWHLETRPDELNKLEDLPLKNAASAIDAKLKETTFQTLVHGDAKLANFCFRADGAEVAAVDFQYVGGGCGMKDLAYFVGSCFRDEEAESRESEVLNFYFKELRGFLERIGRDVSADELEADWRPLYRVAWADFHRFMKGWSPGHWKLSDYSERVTREVIESLQEERV
ncbi:MAG: phosphotransferase [Opitutae bacterium]|nr:phosphotransferase [Opitutae bacterium]